jgi:hypothetical protein
MKARDYIWYVIGGIVIGVGYGALSLLRRRVEGTNKADVDAWANETLATGLARKLNTPPEAILRTLTQHPEPALVELIRVAVAQVAIRFRRMASSGRAEIRLEVAYNDGTSFSASTEWAWDNLPEAVRAGFLRSGAAEFIQPREFQWARDQGSL